MAVKKRTVRLLRLNNPFSNIFVILVITSLILIIILVVMVLIKGPRIREATFNPELPAQYSGEWLLLHANQPLKPISNKQTTVTPSTPINVLSSGSEIAVQFKRRLPYKTKYAVTIASGPVKLKYYFTTPAGIGYYLISPGTIKEHTIGQLTDKVFYKAPFINEFALTGNYMAIAVRNGATDKLIIVNTKTGTSFPANLPQAGTIQKLISSPDGENFSFTFTSQKSSSKTDYNNSLFSFNVIGNKSAPIYGFNRQVLRVTDWAYSPDGSVLLVQTYSSVIEAVYLNRATPPLPIGAFGIISGFSYDGANIYVGTLLKGLEVINIASRTVKFINQEPLGPNSNLLLVTPLLNSNGYIELVQKSIPGIAKLGQYVILVQGNQHRIIYESANGSEAIIGVSLSPNDEYVSIGVLPTSFTHTNSNTPASTLIISLSNAKIIDNLPSLEQVLWQ